MASAPDVPRVPIAELQAHPVKYLGQHVEVAGTLRNQGSDYFRDVRLVLVDSGDAIQVSPWLPITVPPPPDPDIPQPEVQFQYFDKDVVLLGIWTKQEDERMPNVPGQPYFLDTERGQLLQPSPLKPPGLQEIETVPTGEYRSLSGTIDNRRPRGITGQTFPPGSYLILDRPIRVRGTAYREVYLARKRFSQGEHKKLHGRIDVRFSGPFHLPLRSYVELSGISDLSLGEPSFDGHQFYSAQSGQPLRKLVITRQGQLDAPDEIVVLDPPQGVAFLGRMGGFLTPSTNPFHGFHWRTLIDQPSEASQAAVKTDKMGRLINAVTEQPLERLGMDGPKLWCFDRWVRTLYSFATHGTTGPIQVMTEVIHVGPYWKLGAEVKGLLRHLGGNETHPYVAVTERPVRSLVTCDVCRRRVNAGSFTLTNQTNQAELSLPYLAAHALADHGDVHYRSERHQGTIDVVKLQEVLHLQELRPEARAEEHSVSP